MRPRRKADDVCVRFYGTHDIAWISRKTALVPWKLGCIRKLHTKQKRRKVFATALNEVHEICSGKLLASSGKVDERGKTTLTQTNRDNVGKQLGVIETNNSEDKLELE